MMIVRGTTQAQTILTAFDSLGATAPKAVVAAHDLAQRMLAGISKLINGAGDSLPAAVARALHDGVDHAADAEVQRIVTVQALSSLGVTDGVAAIVTERLIATFSEQADAIVKQLAQPFDAAVTKLLEAKAVLGLVDISDMASVLATGGPAPQAWSDATNATKTVDTVRGA